MSYLTADLESVKVYTNGGQNEYGQPTKSAEYSTTMTFKRFKFSSTEDPRFQNVRFLGFTKSKLTDKDYVVRGSKTYHCVMVTFTPKWNVCYLENEY